MLRTNWTCPLFPQDACRAFPDPQDDGLASGPTRNFQILDPLEFLAEFTQHIPPQGAHLIRGHRPKVGRGWYSNKARGMRRKAAQAAATASDEPAAPAPARSRSSQTWAMLIKRVYEFDPLACPRCSGQMNIVAFIEPPQGDVIERILRHCGLWCPSSPRAPPGGQGRVRDPDGDLAASDEPRELSFVDDARFWATC